MYEWKVLQKQIIDFKGKKNPAEDTLNELQKDKWEIVSTHVSTSAKGDGPNMLIIVARKRKASTGRIRSLND